MKAALRTLILTVAATAAASGMTNVMSVDPVKASWSAFGDTIAQLITLNVDTLKRVEVFIGFSAGAGTYSVNILSFPNGTEPLARASGLPPEGNHIWLPFDLTIDYPDSFMKGRRYRVEVTRSGSDSINYYFDPHDPYKYGDIVLPGGAPQPPPTSTDLCARVYGVMDQVDSTFWAYNVLWPDSCPDRTDRTLCFLPALSFPA